MTHIFALNHHFSPIFQNHHLLSMHGQRQPVQAREQCRTLGRTLLPSERSALRHTLQRCGGAPERGHGLTTSARRQGGRTSARRRTSFQQAVAAARPRCDKTSPAELQALGRYLAMRDHGVYDQITEPETPLELEHYILGHFHFCANRRRHDRSSVDLCHRLEGCSKETILANCLIFSCIPKFLGLGVNIFRVSASYVP